ncbi:hypothetical protein BJY16_002271 [Actinoplanes octamycinicus]|uniref:Uncharacterized protein n=1 Tax=Actinoplanes octamycinicus TaxID=135948 RepID=A0A7W7M6G3_9ACTN|nr:hypothetical protein [Actinoplanes octamycinicus]
MLSNTDRTDAAKGGNENENQAGKAAQLPS